MARLGRARRPAGVSERRGAGRRRPAGRHARARRPRGRRPATSRLAGANLAGANLAAANLEGANLEGADLAGADLRRCTLRGARLHGVGAWRRRRCSANLREATGLTGLQFAGADLAGVRLPETLSFDARLDYVAESSQNARPAFLSILLSCVFVILTVFSTTDAALLANASLALLPDLSLDIPAASFFWVAPFLLLGLYVYLHLQMSGIGETLAELPAVFPDGTPLEKRAYPWMATNLLRMKGGWPSFRLEELVAIVLLWGVVPLTLTAVWVRYLPLRNWVLSGVHVALIVLCVWAAMRLFAQTVLTMSRGRLRMRHPRTSLWGLAALLIVATLAVGWAPIVFDANPRRIPSPGHRRPGCQPGRRHPAPQGPALCGGARRQADQRRRPRRRSQPRRLPARGVRRRRNGERPAGRTDLDGADFRNACLRKASLKDADMEDADFRGAYLGLADLRSPLLAHADFEGANLQGADLRGAFLTGANFAGANLRCFASHKKELHPQVECADLTGAKLDGARFPADLSHAKGLTQGQLDNACGDEATLLPKGCD